MGEHNLDLGDFELDEIESIELIGEEDTIDIRICFMPMVSTHIIQVLVLK